MATINLAINGRPCTVDADPQTSLLTVLREHLDLTGSKYGCGEGQCGACTVLIDGKAQRSCITKLATVAQKQITTIEGLATGEQLHPVQEAFLDAAALHMRVDHSPYQDTTVHGWPSLVLARGRVVARDGDFVGEPAAGRYLARRASGGLATPR